MADIADGGQHRGVGGLLGDVLGIGPGKQLARGEQDAIRADFVRQPSGGHALAQLAHESIKLRLSLAGIEPLGGGGMETEIIEKVTRFVQGGEGRVDGVGIDEQNRGVRPG